METTLAIVMLVIAMGFLLIEVFIPSMGILSIASLACFIASLVLGFQESTTLGIILVGVAMTGLPILLWLSFKIFPNTPMGKRMMLFRPKREGDQSPGARNADLVGQEGHTRSMLRPSGVAEIAGRRVDVLTRGEMVEPGVPIEVLEVSGNRVLVRAKRTRADETQPEEKL